MSDETLHDHPASKLMKQEQQPASTDVTELAPGVLRSQLPVDMPGLGHVNCYLLEDDRGVALVDPGLPQQSSYDAIKDRLRQAGIPLHRVHSVVLTHSHPDHFGGAYWLREQTGAEIITHRWYHTWLDASEPPDLDVEEAALIAGSRPWRFRPSDPPPWGHDESNSDDMSEQEAQFLGLPLAQPTIRLDDAQAIRLAGREWLAVHTPGHTDDHLCLLDPTEGLLLAGDHILPTITPHLSGVARAIDPLAQYFHSLDKVRAFDKDVRLVLPAHGHPFADLGGRADAIRQHHDERLDRIRSASASLDRPLTVPEISGHLLSPRAQGLMADAETFAHLEHLRLLGEMERSDDPDSFYRYHLV